MRKTLWILSFLAVTRAAGAAEPTLNDWVKHFEQPATQQAILSQIFSGVGSVSQAQRPKSGSMLLFPRGGMWVRLGQHVAIDPVAGDRTPAYFVVSAMSYQQPDRPPTSGVSYIFRNTTQRPLSLTGGYSANESVHTVSLPKLGRSFILVQGSSPDGSRGHQTTGTLYEISQTGLSSRPGVVWTSPRSVWNFRFGFDSLGGNREALVLKAISAQSEDDFYVYRWDGNKFERDEMTGEGVVENLKDEVWKYGS